MENSRRNESVSAGIYGMLAILVLWGLLVVLRMIFPKPYAFPEASAVVTDLSTGNLISCVVVKEVEPLIGGTVRRFALAPTRLKGDTVYAAVPAGMSILPGDTVGVVWEQVYQSPTVPPVEIFVVKPR